MTIYPIEQRPENIWGGLRIYSRKSLYFLFLQVSPERT